MRIGICGTIGAAVAFSAGVAYGQDAAPIAADLPVREVTVFKDGNAFVLQQGKVAVGQGGTIKLKEVPNPVLGTFWPYSAEKGVTLNSVTVGRRTVAEERTADSISDFLRANVGAEVKIERTINDGKPLEGTVLSVLPEVKIVPPELAVPPANGQGFVSGYQPTNPQDRLVVLKTAQGTVPLPINVISSLTIAGEAKTRLQESLVRNELTLNLTGATAGNSAEIGLMYLQRGLRWIPNYKITLNGKGGAKVQLQATLINELTDLNNTLVNLVIGVPTFAFKDTPDPIGMQDTFARLSRYFTADSPTGQNFSNSIMGQQAARMGERAYAVGRDEGGNAGPGVSAAEKNEDLFLFTVKNLNLKRGERMTLPVVEFDITYKDVYTLELPPAPPSTTQAYYSFAQSPEYARLLATPRVQHQIRLCNTSMYPLTTAPALLLREARVLAQGMMTYTAPGAESDLPLTAAVDVALKRADKETGRTPNVTRIDGNDLTRVDLTGAISLTNYRKEPVALEVTRYVFGTVLTATLDGKVEALDPLTGVDELEGYNLRSLMSNEVYRYNALGKVFWKLSVDPGKTATLNYNWQYLTR